MPERFSPLGMIHEEVRQRRDEGCVVPSGLIQAIEQLHPDKHEWSFTDIDPLYDRLMELEPDPSLAAREPNTLPEIRELRPPGPRVLEWGVSNEERIDRFHGAWIGRATGCALGKPVEGMGMRVDGSGRLVGRKLIRQYLQNRDDWPLSDYFSLRDVGDGLVVACPGSCRENVEYMEPDDDIHYTLVGLGILESCGPEFDWHDVCRYWLSHIPVAAICTAEYQAVINFLNRSSRRGAHCATPAFTRRHRNPFREWVGAQIRSDGWAWACAGKPELAAEFAFRDACWTHERNGIYGEMFFAAIQAAAFVETDPRHLVDIGLSEIPSECRLALAVRECLAWMSECEDWESCMDRLEKAFPAESMSPVHTINNALVCILSLFYGHMDALESLAISVMCGLDTDCNGATVGSVVGASIGRGDWGNPLSDRLHDTIRPCMVGFEEVHMRALAERTLAVWKSVDEYAGDRASVS